MISDNRIFILAEMANGHEGDESLAAKIVDAAATAGADGIKFQFFTAVELAVPAFSYYGLYQKLALPEAAWNRLADRARSAGLKVFADVFGIDSARMAVRLELDGLKIHAADVSDKALLQLVGASGKPVLLSCGGSLWVETAEAIGTLKSAGADEIILMHGFQSYPTKLEDSHLHRVASLHGRFGLPVGFAGHVDGSAPEAVLLPVWAAAAGAELVEVHITDDRSRKGTDYFSALEPQEFKQMVAGVRALEPALGARSLTMPPDEIAYRSKHKKQVVTAAPVKKGDEFTSENIALKRIDNPPMGGLTSLDDVLGKPAMRDIKSHEPIERKDIKLRIAATLACRAESNRLYGKPLQLVGGEPILTHLISQLRKVTLIDEIVLAITEGASRHLFIDYAEKHGLRYILGNEKDVLGRLILAADAARADIAVRATTENPYIYWENLDDMIRSHIEGGWDLSVNEKLPVGSLVEIINITALKRSHQNGEDRHRSEFCSLFISEHPELFKIRRISLPEKLQRPDIRLTVDNPEDLILVRILWDKLHGDGPVTIERIVDYLNANPELAKINQGEKTLYIWK